MGLSYSSEKEQSNQKLKSFSLSDVTSGEQTQ